MKIQVAVGSLNRIKIGAVEEGLNSFIKGSLNFNQDVEIALEGFDVASGVPSQPLGDTETQLGAKNRAKASFEAYQSKYGVSPHFSVGLEGGVQKSIVYPNLLECFAWIVIYNGASESSARTGAFNLPERMTSMILIDGMELGDADDKMFGSINNKQAGGTVGHLTNGIINRTEYYKHAVVLAYIPFHWKELYSTE